MRFHTRKWVKPEDLNANGILFGGKLIAWIDEEAALSKQRQNQKKKLRKKAKKAKKTQDDDTTTQFD